MTTNQKDAKKQRIDIKPEFIISPVPQLPEKKISEAQQIQLEVIAKTNFNFFNGERIAKWLRENHRMWRAVLLPLNYISLRDLEDRHWHADTLYIYPEDGWESNLEEAMKEQSALMKPGGSGAKRPSICWEQRKSKTNRL